MNFKVAVIGEGVIDRFVESGAARDVIGGSPLNTAVALRRAGADATWWAKVSKSAAGESILNYAIENGVAGAGIHSSELPAPIVTIKIDNAGVPAYEFALDGAADWDWQISDFAALAEYDALQIGSLTAVLEPGSSTLVEVLRGLRQSAKPPLISFDPNARPKAAKDAADADRMRSVITELVQLADLVKVSDEDLQWLEPNTPPADVARRWSESNPALVVMTRGSEGSVAYVAGAEIAQVGGVKVEVVDTVGAGDTFMAWLLNQVLQAGEIPQTKPELEAILAKSARAAAITCSRKGCNPPFANEL